MSDRGREDRLLARALRLRIAEDGDFVVPKPEVAPDNLRVVDAHALRRQLIAAGYAEVIQAPRGRRRCAAIVLLHTNGNAPKSAKSVPSPPTTSLPTIEDIRALLDRIAEVENDVGKEMKGRADAEITRLKKQIGNAQGDDFERAFRELEVAMRQREALRTAIRGEAFQRVDADSTFAPGRYLAMISSDCAQGNSAASARPKKS
jgi:hypothetical protein